MVYIGIGRGTDGTIGIIHENGDVEFHKVPWKYSKLKYERQTKRLNHRKFAELLRRFAAEDENEVRQRIKAKVLIEAPVSSGCRLCMKKLAGVLSTTRFYDAECAVLETLGISYEVIQPSEWMHNLFTGLYAKLPDRDASLEYGNNLYPQLKQEKAKDRDGICLAWYLQNMKDFKKRV